jgi:ankyrin repeat protein
MPQRRDKRAERPLPPRGTTLHYVAFYGLHEVRVLAIEHPEDVNSWSADDVLTPLHLASQEGHVEVVRFLVEHGVDAAAQDQCGRTPLHRASERGHLGLARFLIEHGTNINNAAQDNGGSTPLRRASSSDLVRFLVERGADVAAQEERGQTPLHDGVIRTWHGSSSSTAPTQQPRTNAGGLRCIGRRESGHLDMARVLVEHGADATAQDKCGWTPRLHVASSSGPPGPGTVPRRAPRRCSSPGRRREDSAA